MILTDSTTHPSKIFDYCPKCSHTDFIFDGIKKFTCKSCNFIYYINPAPAVAVIIELPDNRIILTRRKFDPRAGTLDLPGGFIDCMESAEDAVTREIKEELGIEVRKPIYLASFPNEYVFKEVSYFTCDLAFIVKLDYIPEMVATDDVSEAIMIHPKNINFDTISYESIINILKVYMQTI
jgi:NAD+ diphosphatase